MDDSDLVQQVYREFGTEPLDPDHQAQLYVDLDDARGRMDAVSRLEKKIRLAEGRPTCQVLAGHRGSGKSTELLRLKKSLESGKGPLFVVYVQADDDIDRNDVDFPDILIAVVRQLATQLKDREGISLKPGYFKQRLERVKQCFTSEISFDGFELGVGLAKLSGEIKGSPDARNRIRAALEPDTSNLRVAANDVIGEAVSKLAAAGKGGLVVLMDDLDKMVIRERAGTDVTTDEYLFVHRAAQLTAFACHVVYTIPISLAYSHQEQAIKASFGGHVPVVPMTKVRGRPPEAKPYEPGVEKFRQIIARRLEKADAKEKDVFDGPEVIDELIALSGGQPTELMTLVREALIAHDGLPINAEALERAKIEGRREYARLLREGHWPIIK